MFSQCFPGRFCHLFGSAAALLFCAGLMKAQDPGAVSREDLPAQRAVIYSSPADGCRLQWRYYVSGLNQGLIKSETTCTRPLLQQKAGLQALWLSLHREAGEASRPRTLFWGRLLPDTPQDDLDMSFRLAAAAHRSPEWNSARGVARTGNNNRVAARLAEEARIYRDLEEVFAPSGYRIKISSVEKVLVLKAETLPYWPRLKGEGVDGKEKLPIDFMVHFSLTAADSSPNR
jgi:hypothetical protein